MLRFATYGAHSAVVTKRPCGLRRLDGYVATADGWIQVFDAIALPTNGTVPLRSFFAQGNFAYAQVFSEGELPLALGLVVALSTTEATLTISANNADFLGEASQPNEPDPTLVGDDTTGVNVLQVYSEATGAATPKRLLSSKIVDSSGVVRYVMLFAKDSPSTGDIPIQQWQLAANATLDLRFGPFGILPDFLTTAFARKTGCTIGVSTTTGTYTQIASADATISAQIANV